VVETNLPAYYESSAPAEGTDITIVNTERARKDVTVEVRWDDGSNPYRIPEEVVLYLLADGMEEIRQTFRPANGKVKVAVFEGVPSYIKGKAVSGTVLETGAAGGSSASAGAAAGGSAATHSAATHSAADGTAGAAGSATNVGTVPCFTLLVERGTVPLFHIA